MIATLRRFAFPRSGPGWISFPVVAALFVSACSARPGWTTRLPSGAIAGDRSESGIEAGVESVLPDSEFTGDWSRLVDSRYGVGNPRAHSIGSETLSIARRLAGGDGLAYTKTHLYREQVGREVLTRGYREFGRLERRGRYLLLRPLRAESFGPVYTQAPPDQAAVAIILPPAAAFAWEPAGTPDALLYFFEAERREASPHYKADRVIAARLTPLAYEAFGEIFDYGIFEGTREPYDFDSQNFRDAVDIWNGKRNQPHAYIRRASNSDD